MLLLSPSYGPSGKSPSIDWSNMKRYEGWRRNRKTRSSSTYRIHFFFFFFPRSCRDYVPSRSFHSLSFLYSHPTSETTFLSLFLPSLPFFFFLSFLGQNCKWALLPTRTLIQIATFNWLWNGRRAGLSSSSRRAGSDPHPSDLYLACFAVENGSNVTRWSRRAGLSERAAAPQTQKKKETHT